MTTSYTSFKCNVCSTEHEQFLPLPFVFVCNSCQSLIEYESNLKLIDLNKKIDDFHIISIISIGSTGSFANTDFTIVGLIRNTTNEEYIDSWLCLFKDDTKKWLRRINNAWYFFEDDSIELSSSLIKSKKAGNALLINDVNYIIKTISKELGSKIAGQIPSKKYFVALAFKVLLITDDGKAALEISLFDLSNVKGCKGKLIELEALNLSGLKQYSNWS